MEDERVDRLLKTLRDAPPATASAGFTERVLARLDAPRGASANWLPRLTLPAAALAATVVVAASLLFSHGELPGRPPAPRPALAAALSPAASPESIPTLQGTQVVPAASRISARDLRDVRGLRARRLLAQIQSEQARLASDLHRLRRSGDQPVVYVGGDEQVDLIVDLDRVRDLPTRRGRNRAPVAADPAASLDAVANQTF